LYSNKLIVAPRYKSTP